MKRLATALCALLLAAAPVLAQERGVAALLPGDTFLYVEADAGALMEGLPGLDLLRLLGSPAYRDFLRPGLERAGLDAEDPVAALLAHLPVRQYLHGKLAFGLRGFTVRLVDPDGTAETLVVSPDRPVDAALLYRVLGRTMRWERLGVDGTIDVRPDFMLVAEPGPLGRQMLHAMLQDAGSDIRSDAVQIGGHSLTRLRASERLDAQVRLDLEVYADLRGDRWIFATDPEALVKALAGGPRDSLADSPRCGAVRARMTGGRPALFAFVDVAAALRMAERFVPPIVAESMAMSGLASLRGAGFGLSLGEGGVRESFGLVLDGEPKGVWRLLDCMPGGLRSLEISPPEAIAVVGAKFDLKLLVERLEETVKALMPGNEEIIREGARDLLRGSPLDLEKDLLPAFGDEIGLILFPPPPGSMMPVPGWVLGLEVRDEAAFGRMLDLAKAAIEGQKSLGIRFAPLKLEGGIDAFQTFAMLPMAPPVFAVHRGHFFGASDKDLLHRVLTVWGAEGSKSLSRDGEVFGKVLKGLNGGERENVALLAYLDVRNTLPIALANTIGRLPPGYVDLAHTPDFEELAGHLSGVAIGLRRDGQGITLDAFSPVGAVIPAAILGVAETRRQQAEFERQMALWREFEELNRLAESPDAPFLGVSFEATGDGVMLGSVVEGAPGEKAGLRAEDRVLRVAGEAVAEPMDVRRLLVRRKPGEAITVQVVRGNEVMEVAVTLGRRGDFIKRDE